VDQQRIRLIILIVVFSFTFGGVRAATRYRLGQQRIPIWSVIPNQIGDWQGVDGRFDPIYGSDPADSSLLRVYRRDGAPPIIVYVGFFRDLAQVMEVHTPELCYPAQGWGIRTVSKSAAGTFRGLRIPAQVIAVDKNGDRRLVMWWYNAGSRPFQTRIRYVYAMLLMSAFTGRTDGSMVRLETPLAEESEAAAVARIEEFRKSFLPPLNMALPR